MPKISSYPAAGAPQTGDGFVLARSGKNYLVLWEDLIPRVVTLLVTDPQGDVLATGNGKLAYRIPSVLNGWNLTGVAAHVTTVSSSGVPTIQLRNATDAVDMLSTRITIDEGEKDSSTAATPTVIDTTHDDVATGDEINADIFLIGFS